MIVAHARYAFRDNGRFSSYSQIFGIERLRNESSLADVKQVARRCIGNARHSAEEDLCLLRIKRAETNVMILSRRCVAEKYKVMTIWQEVRPAVRFFLRIDFRGEYRSPTLG